ncbi:T9SS type A sorting domain-containing protein [Marixanthomonas ophiurae]|uniref:T9SS C-terminal target domain-containing protein n=1 Tax=Marixanthomonas ophiurae TaxID=387659 RepID=A0A3E1Q660_9FLAO|nr:T9SS type A sorting domain-containing protein [Marixanthomonas ophiurae]RFN57611.1 T9SS C-terminal target domain-containing protein [Marixanthomonas ophiurae]
MRFKILLLAVFAFVANTSFSQEYLKMIDAGTYKVQDVIDSAEAYFDGKDKGRGTGYKQFKRWEYNALRLQNENGYLTPIDKNIKELQRYNAYLNSTAGSREVLNDNWTELGPTSWSATSGWNPGVGRVTGFSVDAADNDHIIIGANTGGVWKTTNGGQDWSPLNDNFTNLSVYAVTMDPADSNTYFSGSTSGIIFKSEDAGATWNPLADLGNSLVNKILINPNDSNIMFASSQNAGIYRTTDGGSNWDQVTTDSNGFDIEFKPGDPSVVYASGTGFHKSTDGGATFTQIGGFSNGPKMIGISADDDSVVYVLEASGGLFGGFYASSDGGDNFTELDHAGKNYFGYSTTAQDNRGQAPRDMDIAVNPTDANEVHIAGILTWRSTDGGSNFNITSDWIPGNAAGANIGYCHADVDIMEFVGTTLYLGTDGGIFKADNTGNVNSSYYTDLTEGLGIRQFYKIGVSQTQDVIVSGGSQDNGTSVYTEAQGWQDWLGADGMETFVDYDNTNNLYGTSQYGSLYRSNNGGASYFGLNAPASGNWITPFEQDPTVPATLYTGYSSVYKSINRGSSWTSISQSFGSNLSNLKIAPSNNQIMYATRGGLIYKTTDGGATDWETLPLPGGAINYIAIHPTNPDKVAVATTSGSKVFVSEDGGETWENYLKNLPNFSALSVVWDDNGADGLYLGMNYGIYYIDNGLTEWQPYSNNIPNVQVNELEINNETDMLYAATYGRGLWASPVEVPTLSVEDKISEENVSVYPNPANDELNIKLSQNLEADIRIFDTLGKLVVYQPNVNISGNYSVGVSNLNSGIYFVRINTEAGTVTKKFIKN